MDQKGAERKETTFSGGLLEGYEHRERRSVAFALPFSAHLGSLTRTRFGTVSVNRTGAVLLKQARGSGSRSGEQNVLSRCRGGKSTCTKLDPDKGKGWSDPGALQDWFSSTAQFKEIPSGPKEGQCVMWRCNQSGANKSRSSKLKVILSCIKY